MILLPIVLNHAATESFRPNSKIFLKLMEINMVELLRIFATFASIIPGWEINTILLHLIHNSLILRKGKFTSFSLKWFEGLNRRLTMHAYGYFRKSTWPYFNSLRILRTLTCTQMADYRLRKPRASYWLSNDYVEESDDEDTYGRAHLDI